MKARRVLVAVLVLLIAGCGGTTRSVPTATGEYKVGSPYRVNGVWYHPKADPYYDRTGIASWYGGRFHGRQTANGEIFDANKLTAAHTTLPMPSLVRVTNLANGRSVVLRVNDRGPFVRGRIIDVSRRAAQLLGFKDDGVARVRVQAYPYPDSDAPTQVASAGNGDDDTRWLVEETLAKTSPKATRLYVQAGAFSERRAAEAVRADLARVGNTRITEVTLGGSRLFRVRIGPLPSVGAADRVLARVVGYGHDAARIVVECMTSC